MIKKSFLPKNALSQSDRKSVTSLDKSDLQIILTTNILENAIQSIFHFKNYISFTVNKDSNEVNQDPHAKGCEKLYKKLRIFRKIFFFFYMSLLLFQRPIWCDKGEFLV